MKRMLIPVVSVGVVVTLIFGVLPAMADKPDNPDHPHDVTDSGVIILPNGFPIGEHYNLNIHGKEQGSCDSSVTDGHSVFVPLRGEATITYVSGSKKSSLLDLAAVDPCSEYFDGTPARVEIPYEKDGYLVFGRILGKPQNGTGATASSMIITPGALRVCDGDGCSDDGVLMPLGLITVNGNYYYDPLDGTFKRFADTTIKGKGKSKAQDITGMFTWTGWVADAILDKDLDGDIDIDDIPADYVTPIGIDADDLGPWLSDVQSFPDFIATATSITYTDVLGDWDASGGTDSADVVPWLSDKLTVNLDKDGNGEIDSDDLNLSTFSGSFADWILARTGHTLASLDSSPDGKLTVADVPYPAYDLDGDYSINIEEMRRWLGHIQAPVLDKEPDGDVDGADKPIGYDTFADWMLDLYDKDNDGDIEEATYDADGYLVATNDSLAVYHSIPTWVFNIAELVEQDQMIDNDGAKLVQIRFYPVDTVKMVETEPTP
jgi:hypothetical protein